MVMIEDDIRLDPATSGEGSIVPEGRYVLHLIRMEKAPPSDFNPEAGDRIKWVFHLYDQQGQQFYFQNEPYEFFRTTSRKNSPRAFARQYTEGLLGRRLSDGEVPPLRSLVGKKMSGLISYGPSDVDPTKEVLKLTSLKSVMDQAPAPSAPSPKPAPGQVSADPTDDEIDRALVVSKIQKSLKRLKALDAEAGAQAQKAVDDSDMDESLLDDLNALAEQISAAVRKAMDE